MMHNTHSPNANRPQNPVSSAPASHKGPKRTFSARIEPDIYARLDRRRSETGMSFSEMLREYLGAAGTREKQAYDRGFDDATRRFAVAFPCCICGKECLLTTGTLTDDVSRYITQYKSWGHADCIEAAER